MVRSQALTKPKKQSVLLSLVVAGAAFAACQISPLIGYFVALLTLIMMIVASLMDSMWPTKMKQENTLVFSLFWGLILGVVVPYIVSTFLDGGVAAVYEMFTRDV